MTGNVTEQFMPSADNVTGSHLIGKTLKAAGVSTVFTLAGDHNLPLLDALADMDFRIIDTRHEAAAVHMADAWARVTGEPGVVTYTTPGFANGIPGLSSAMYSEAPLLSISGSAPLSELGQGAMQEIDQIGMAKPVTKSAAMVTDGRRIPGMIAEALRLAYSGRRGPVHLTVPIDIQEREVPQDEAAIPQPHEYLPDATTVPTDEQIRQAVALLQSAERPIIIAGSAASYSGNGETLQSLIETTRIPLMTESSARGLVSDEHPYSAGFYDNGLNRAARKLREADVILLLGMKQDIIIGYTRPPTVSPDAKIVQVDPSPMEIGRNREVAVGIVGDVEEVVARMTAEAAKHTWRDLPWLDELREVRNEQRAELEALAEPSVPIHALHVHKTLLSLIDEGDFLVFDGGDFCHWGRGYLPARTPRHVVVLLRSGDAGYGHLDRDGGEARPPGTEGRRDLRRRRVRVQRDGVRHRLAARHRHNDRARQRRIVGHRPADTAAGLRQARGHRPPARPLRPARRVPRRRGSVRAGPSRSP